MQTAAIQKFLKQISFWTQCVEQVDWDTSSRMYQVTMIFFKNFSERSANNDYWPATWSLSGKVVANKGQRSVASDLRERERELRYPFVLPNSILSIID